MKDISTSSKKTTGFKAILTGLSLGIFLAFQACKESGNDPIAPYDYYPVTMGKFQIYQVEEEVYSSGTRIPVIKNWQEKDEIIGSSHDANGSLVYMVSRSSRNTADQPWVKTKEYSVRHDPDKIIVNLDNEIFMPLVFPYNSQIEWDGYQFFHLDDDDPRYDTKHRYSNINQPLKVNSLQFDKTIKVEERTDTTGMTQYRLGYKEYAAGVGLVVDQQINFEYLQENGELIGDKLIGSGVRRTRKIIEFGTNQ